VATAGSSARGQKVHLNLPRTPAERAAAVGSNVASRELLGGTGAAVVYSTCGWQNLLCSSCCTTVYEHCWHAGPGAHQAASLLA